MIHADLSDRQDGWREQLWTRQLTEDTFEVACLPFFTYGICYRDVVTIDSNHLLTGVVRKSGHRTLRVALIAEHTDRDQIHELLHGKAVDADLPHEWLQGTYLAVDLGGGRAALPGADAGQPRSPGAHLACAVLRDRGGHRPAPRLARR
ncbi:DUF4265 domain-containing protein, partial [Streptomyces olivaceus]|uniref:DUF4265 domain-containing protein n=1 Tax=Streptomyces olivaceus TaxID=47716 RepID=UPI001CCEA450